MNELMVFEIKTTETIDIVCYEGNYYELYENEDELCHFFKIEPADKNILEKIRNNVNLIEYLMYINEDKKEIEFYNMDDGDTILFNYIELNEIKYGHEKIIKSKIEYLLNENNKLNNTSLKIYNKIKDIIIFFNKELINTNKKIEFYEKNNDIKNLSKNIGKQEMLEKILDTIKNIK
jgi:hypothetical protein